MPSSAPITDVASIAHTIQLAVAPVFLLAGISGFLNMLAGRLARVVDRSRALEAQFTAPDRPDHARQMRELRLLDRRIVVINRAIYLCTASAIAICLVVAGLFIAALGDLGFARTMAVAFVLAMLLLVSGLVHFLVEVRLALRTIRVSDELLERELR
jgi:hypothetical protein